MNKREFLKKGIISTAGIVSISLWNTSKANSVRKKRFYLPKLSYSFNSLSSFIDETSLNNLYHNYHTHYTTRLNNACSQAGINERYVRNMLKHADQFPSEVIECGAEYINHNLFWNSISPYGGGEPFGAIQQKIINNYGSFSNFKDRFIAKALEQADAGWIWITVSKNKLHITSSKNNINPIKSLTYQSNSIPLLCLNVNEHVYKKKYGTHKNEYLNAYWKYINWNTANKKLNKI